MNKNQNHSVMRATDLNTRGILLASLSGLLLVTSAFAQPRYAITDLGVLPGNVASVASSINDRGDIVGYSNDAAGSTAVVWRGGVIGNLGKLSGGNYSMAMAINAKGQIVGDGDTGNFRPQGWVTTATGLYNFFPNNGGNTHAIAISDTGVIGGYYTKSLSGWVSSWRGSIWTPDPKDARKYRQTDLPILLGPDPKFKGTTALPMDFNQSGQAAGYAVNEVIGQHACFWNSDAAHSIVDLGVFGDDWSSLGLNLNDLGQVVGESHPAFGSRPVLWDSDAAHTAYELPLLPGDNYGTATAINNTGQILGWSAASEPFTWNVGPARFVVWIAGVAYDLAASLDAVTGAGWTITNVSGINNLGQIVGSGTHNGLNRAFVLTPIAP